MIERDWRQVWVDAEPVWQAEGDGFLLRITEPPFDRLVRWEVWDKRHGPGYEVYRGWCTGAESDSYADLRRSAKEAAEGCARRVLAGVPA